MSVFFCVFFETDRHLPAHIGFPIHVSFTGFHSGDMQCTARSASKSGLIVEYARTIHNSCFLAAVFRYDVPALLVCDFLVLPVVVLQKFARLFDHGEILLVKKVRTI